MTKEEAQMIVDELYNEVMYNVEIIPCCYENYIVRISDKDMFETSMFVNPKIIEVCNKRGKGFHISSVGDGQRYMRIAIF